MCIETLLRYGAQTNYHDVNGVTPLMLSASNGHTACVKLLLQVMQRTGAIVQLRSIQPKKCGMRNRSYIVVSHFCYLCCTSKSPLVTAFVY